MFQKYMVHILYFWSGYLRNTIGQALRLGPLLSLIVSPEIRLE